MFRVNTWAISTIVKPVIVILVLSTSVIGQQTAPTSQQQQQQQAGQPAAQIAAQGRAQAAPQQPFPPLNAAENAQLQSVLLKWQAQSQGTKTLDCKFARWHFDNLAAPAGIHATRADGVVKYAAPDKGLFRVDQLVFYAGMKDGKPEFKPQPGQFGEHWVCNGKQLIEFDRTKEECRIQDLPPEMQGQNIISSPLPFVFNLDAAQIQQRYWIRLRDVGNPQVFLVEAYPKRQEDRAQYKFVQIALNASTFAPQALIMYAPNYDVKTNAKKDHYEFSDVKRNAIGALFQKFLKNFIPEQPPTNWTIVHEKFKPSGQPQMQQAQGQRQALEQGQTQGAQRAATAPVTQTR